VLFVSGHRSDNFIVGLTDVSPAITAPTLWNYDLCARYPGVVGDGATVNLTCTSCVPPRRYLIVQVETSNGRMNFCEIEVYVRGKLLFASLCAQRTVTKSHIGVELPRMNHIRQTLQLLSYKCWQNFMITKCK